MSTPIAICNCPSCVDHFAFDLKRVEQLKLYTHVTLRCPMCRNEVLLILNGYEIIKSGQPENYQWGEILRIEPPPSNFKPAEFRVDLGLRVAVAQKYRTW